MIKRSISDVKSGVTYLVAYGANPTERFRAIAWPNRTAAVHAAADQRIVPPGDCGLTIETAAEVPWNGKELVAVYNELTGEHVTRFKTLSIGVARLLAALARIATPAQPQHVPTMTNRTEHEEWMRDNAEMYVATAFRGVPKVYDKREAKTLDEARSLALSLYEDRPVAIYAIYGGRQVHIENYPQEEKTVSESKSKRKPREPKPTVEKKKRVRQPLGEFKPVREGSSLHRIIESTLRGGRTYAQISQETGLREDQTSHRIRHVLGVKHGIGHSRDENGVVTLHLPEGKTEADLIKSKESQQEAA